MSIIFSCLLASFHANDMIHIHRTIYFSFLRLNNRFISLNFLVEKKKSITLIMFIHAGAQTQAAVAYSNFEGLSCAAK